jgi:hypothetical protein
MRIRRILPNFSTSRLMLEKRRNRQAFTVSQSSKKGCGGRVTHLAELGKVDLKGLRIILKAERNHRVENILATDRLSLLKLALLRRFGGDEADELGHALLHALLGIFRDFSRWWHGVLHDTRNIRNLFFFFERRRSPAAAAKMRNKS